jgi:hypothetical protein
MRATRAKLLVLLSIAFASFALPALADNASYDPLGDIITLAVAAPVAASVDDTIAPAQTISSVGDSDVNTSKHCLGTAEATVSNNYVYGQTRELDSKTVTGQAEVYVACGNWTPDVLGITSQDFHELELNLYYDNSAKLPVVGEIKFEAMSGFWLEDDGNIVPLYGEVSKDFIVDKGRFTITPFAGYGQWFGFGKESDRGYAQWGVRTSTQVTSKISFAGDVAYSLCVRENRLPSKECHDAPYANVEGGYDLGHHVAILARMRFTEGEPNMYALVLQYKF